MLDYSASNLITPEEVKIATGIDLSLRLMDDDNPSNKCERFIHEQQTLLYSYIAKNYKRDLYKYYYTKLNEQEKEYVKIAIALQCQYTILNGNLGMDASLITGNKSMTKAYAGRICVNAIDELAQIRQLTTSKLHSRSWLSEYMHIELFGK